VKLEGKVAIVTGSGRGIGKAIALAFADAGADVVTVARTTREIEATATEIRAKGRKSLALTTDVCQRAQVASMAQRAAAEFGRIDILVNDAGGGVGVVDLLEVDDQQWDAVFNLNAKAAFLCCQAVARIMIPQRSGNMINISSGASLVALPGHGHYGAAKAALNHLSQTFSVILGPYGIRVNVIAPSSVRTQASRDHYAKHPERYASRLSKIPLGAFGTPEDIAEVAVFLASDASRYITGTIIQADGGHPE